MYQSGPGPLCMWLKMLSMLNGQWRSWRRCKYSEQRIYSIYMEFNSISYLKGLPDDVPEMVWAFANIRVSP